MVLSIIESIRSHARAGEVTFTWYADRRMVVRNISSADALRALATANRCIAEPGGGWRVTGASIDGDERTFIVNLAPAILVIAIF